MISPFKIALLLSYICVASFSAAIITPALPHLAHAYALSHGSLEWVISIFLIGYVIGQLVYGPIANRFGRLTALRAGLVINLIGIVICIAASSLSIYSLLLVGRLITALGAASGLSCTFMLLNELLPPDRARHAVAFATISFTVAIGLAVSLGGFITQYMHWQYCFWVLLAHGCAMLALTWQFPETLKEPTALHPKIIFSKYMQAFKHRRLVIFSLGSGLVSTFVYGYSAAAPIYAQTTLHLSPSQYGSWNLINMLGMLSGGFLSAYLIKKYHEKIVLLLGLSLMIPGIISLAAMSMTSTPCALWFFTTTMMLNLFCCFVFPTASHYAANAIADKANASSTMSFINMGSAMIGVIILGYLPFTSILSFTLVFAIFFSVIALLIVWQLLEKTAAGNEVC